MSVTMRGLLAAAGCLLAVLLAGTSVLADTGCVDGARDVIDNNDPARFWAVDGWTMQIMATVSNRAPHYGNTALNSKKIGGLEACFNTSGLDSGTYEVGAYFQAGPSRRINTNYTIVHAGGQTTVWVDQTVQPDINDFLVLGTYTFTNGVIGAGVYINSGPTNTNQVMVDAVSFVRVCESTATTNTPSAAPEDCQAEIQVLQAVNQALNATVLEQAGEILALNATVLEQTGEIVALQVINQALNATVQAQAANLESCTFTPSPTTTGSPTSASPTSASPTSASPTSASPTSVSPTSASPTSVSPTSVSPTSASPTSVSPTSASPSSVSPTSASPTSVSPTTTAGTAGCPAGSVFEVTGADAYPDFNSCYKQDGTFAGAPHYYKVNADGSFADNQRLRIFTSNGIWRFYDSIVGLRYYVLSSAATPPTTGWLLASDNTATNIALTYN